MPLVHWYPGAGPWYLYRREVSIYRANGLGATIPLRTYFRQIKAIFLLLLEMAV